MMLCLMKLLEPQWEKFVLLLNFFIWLDDPHLTYKHNGEDCIDSHGNSAFCINLWKLALRGHLNTDAQARDRTRNILLTITTR